MLRAMYIITAQLKKRRVLVSDLETILPIFLQRRWLLFALVLKTCLRLYRSFGFMALAEEISRLLNIDCPVVFTNPSYIDL